MKKLLFLMMATVLVSVVAYGRTVNVASVEDDSHGRHVRANLSLSSGDVAVLHLAYGATAGDDDIDSWDHCRPVALIPGATTSYTYEFPRDIGDDVGAVRFFLLEDYDLPLTKRYACIETDGTQFVRTAFLPTGYSAVEMELSLNSADADVALFGTRTLNNGGDSFTAFYIAGSGWRFDYFKVSDPVLPTAVANTYYTLRLDGSGIYLDGALISSLVTRGWAKTTNPLVLFGAPTPDTQVVRYMPSAKFRSLKAWSDYRDGATSLALDLIPTEKDGETCLYNRIDGTYLKSAVAGHTLSHGEEVAVVRPAVVAQSSTLAGRFGAERTMRVTAKHRSDSTRRLSSVDLAFTTGLDRELYVAYGRSDCGDNIADWQNVWHVGIIPGSTNEYSFIVPESWGGEIRAMRLFLMDKEYFPGCDSVCEGVAVDGVYVATSFTPMSVSVIDMSISFDTVSESQTIFCARDTAGNPDSMTLFYIAGQGWRLDYVNKQYTSSTTAEIGRKYDINVTGLGLKVDNADVINPQYWEYTAGSTLALFVASYSGHPERGSYPFKGTLYSFKARRLSGDPSSVELDLVPCQKDGQAYLYNRVNGELLSFGGSGTATPVGVTSNGAVIETTGAFSIYQPGLVVSFH